ncbi:indeterminate-domain 5 protein [Nymphaea thermarum]|nr:indeterminate-domain 5 protein [Nymphaea thermarum]
MAAGPPPKMLFGIMDEEEESCIGSSQDQAKQPPASTNPTTSTSQKKKRNLPGTPSKFICEVCNKGFQREQNLQLHRRGHNLPWKLKQKSTKEVKKRVYLCPEPTCVHHDPSRALGDLTGIKKHFCRKHGEKKWKCEKCSKRYAVQSDWKAHSKTCGTREYRCDCGTLFSRRDSFITHRAFCDALAQESARHPSGLSAIGGQLYNSNNNSMGVGVGISQIGSIADQSHPSANILRLGGAGGPQFDHLISPSNLSSRPPQPPPSAFFSAANGSNQDFHDQDTHHGLLQNKSSAYPGFMSLANLPSNSADCSGAKLPNSLFNLSFFSSNSNKGDGRSNNAHLQSANSLLLQDQFSGSIVSDQMASSVPSLYNSQLQHDTILPQMSATALLQKAAQLGATTSTGNHESLIRAFNSPTSNNTSHDASSMGINLPWQDQRAPTPSSAPPPPSSLAATTHSPSSSRPQLISSIPARNLQGLDHMRPNFGTGDDTNIQEIMNSLVNGSGSMFRDDGRGVDEYEEYNGSQSRMNLQGTKVSNKNAEGKINQNAGASSSSMGPTDGLTRDFLGVGAMSRGFMGGGFSHRDHHIPQPQQHNMNLVTLDSEMKSLARSYSERMQ